MEVTATSAPETKTTATTTTTTTTGVGYTVGYATAKDASTKECYNERFLSMKSECYNERGGILSADVAYGKFDYSFQ